MIKAFSSESEQLTDYDLTTICMTSVEPGGIAYISMHTLFHLFGPQSATNVLINI